MKSQLEFVKWVCDIDLCLSNTTDNTVKHAMPVKRTIQVLNLNLYEQFILIV